MFVTQFGSFNGNTWEDLFQIILKNKYMAAGYVRIKASPGDFGIEGYTKTGLTFQCYCPDVNLETKSLYEKQRDKITTDINKLKINKDELEKILGGTKLKTWILITPTISHHDLINHCNGKRDLVKSWNLPFIDNNVFEVLVHEATDYAIEIGQYFNHTNKKFTLIPQTGDSSNEKLIEWKETKIELVSNAIEKNEIRIKSSGNEIDLDRKTNELTNESVRYYLNGESMLRVWSSSQPDNHQRFTELLGSLEEELKERSLLNSSNPNDFVKSVSDYVENKIKSAFEYLDESTIIRLKNYSIASWILRCPLYFEIVNDDNK